jgi:polar amino acid transport system ATP-binding protein
MTIVMATHEMSFAHELTDHVCFRSAGQILEQGTVEQVLTDPQERLTLEILARFLR